jgi:hypothetical protein
MTKDEQTNNIAATQSAALKRTTIQILSRLSPRQRARTNGSHVVQLRRELDYLQIVRWNSVELASRSEIDLKTI